VRCAHKKDYLAHLKTKVVKEILAERSISPEVYPQVYQITAKLQETLPLVYFLHIEPKILSLLRITTPNYV